MRDKNTTEVPILEVDDAHPLTLARVIDYCEAGERTGHLVPAPYIRALVSSWARLAGNADEALLTATPDELADAVRDYSDSCESCRKPLPAWVEAVFNDVPLAFCPSCAVAEQRANPQDWREYLADRSFDTFGASA